MCYFSVGCPVDGRAQKREKLVQQTSIHIPQSSRFSLRRRNGIFYGSLDFFHIKRWMVWGRSPFLPRQHFRSRLPIKRRRCCCATRFDYWIAGRWPAGGVKFSLLDVSDCFWLDPENDVRKIMILSFPSGFDRESFFFFLFCGPFVSSSRRPDKNIKYHKFYAKSGGKRIASMLPVNSLSAHTRLSLLFPEIDDDDEKWRIFGLVSLSFLLLGATCRSLSVEIHRDSRLKLRLSAKCFDCSQKAANNFDSG